MKFHRKAKMDIETLNNSKKIIYVSDGTWFKAGTACELIANCDNFGGIFRGCRIKQNESENPLIELGEEYLDEELCSWDEFKII